MFLPIDFLFFPAPVSSSKEMVSKYKPIKLLPLMMRLVSVMRMLEVAQEFGVILFYSTLFFFLVHLY